MTDITNTRRATTTANKRERQSCGAPHGTLDQALLWNDVRQCLLFVATFVAIGGASVWFLLLPRYQQAIIVYAAIVAGCAALILAGLRRREK